MKKHAILSMDLEDWYHLDYFKNYSCDRSYSMLDGVEKFCEILQNFNIPSNFFIVGEIVKQKRRLLNTINNEDNDIGSHGWDHKRPIMLNISKFTDDLKRSKHTLEDILGRSVEGYRAPCFSIDRQRLEKVKEVGYLFDSSRISFDDHPLYQTINIDGFDKVANSIYKLDNFFEFQVSTNRILNKNIPISGGGYLRILPWQLSKNLIKSYLQTGDLYILYVHPFELSLKSNPSFSREVKVINKIRFGFGRRRVSKKLIKLITLLKQNGYSFTTFSKLRKKMLNNRQ